ncbi:hypothetical protein BGZ76_001574, partial [Entomortierella beljakovae]
MNHNLNVPIAAATASVALASAYLYSRQSTETGKEPWNDKKDPHYQYDYVILGGGTAGCVLASRLSEDPNISVLVIEAGEDMDNSTSVKMPMGIATLHHSKHDWLLKTVPQTHANGREIVQTRGRLLGGCSSLNGMQYTRGPRSDFNRWATLSEDHEWSYDKVLPYFKKSECFHDPSLDPSHERGPRTPRAYDAVYDTFEKDLHGTDGPWHLSFHHLFPAAKGFIEASVKEGVPRLLDPSSFPSIGVFRAQSSVQADAVRSSASRAFLGPKVVPGGGSRGRVRILLNSYIERIIIEEQNGSKRAIGAEFRDNKNVLRKVYAKREVLVCGGVFHTPSLLLASGIGYKIHDSIPLVHPLKGVGENLSDPISIPLVFKVPAHIKTIHTAFSPMNAIPEIYKYFRHGTGALSNQLIDASCFLRLEDISPEFVAQEKANGTWKECASGPDAPHIEIMFTACFIKKAIDTEYNPGKDNFYGMIIVLLNPASMGRVSVKVNESTSSGKNGRSLRVEPLVDTNYLGDDFDTRALGEAMKFARKIGRRMQLDPEFGGGEEHYPGQKLAPDGDDVAMAEFIRQECFSSFHATGTSMMGPSCNPDAVVDSKLRVHGIDRLRIVDGSIFPRTIA